MAGVRAQKLVATRKAILDAALEKFCDDGYHATAVPALAEHAKVGTGTIYRHFANKEELVNAVFQRCKQALSDALYGDLDVAGLVRRPAREAVQEVFGRLLRFAETHPRELAFIEFHHHADYLDATSMALERDSLAPIAAWFEVMQGQGQLRPVPTPLAVAMLWGAFVGLIKAQRLGLVTIDEAAQQAALDTAWRALTPDGEDS